MEHGAFGKGPEISSVGLSGGVMRTEAGGKRKKGKREGDRWRQEGDFPSFWSFNSLRAKVKRSYENGKLMEVSFDSEWD